MANSAKDKNSIKLSASYSVDSCLYNSLYSFMEKQIDEKVRNKVWGNVCESIYDPIDLSNFNLINASVNNNPLITKNI